MLLKSKVRIGDEEGKTGECGFAIHALFASVLMRRIARKLISELPTGFVMNFKVNLPNADTKELVELRVSPGFSVSIASWQVHKVAKMIKIIVCFIIKPEVLNDHKANSTYLL